MLPMPRKKLYLLLFIIILLKSHKFLYHFICTSGIL